MTSEINSSLMYRENNQVTEQDIVELVRRFYERAATDDNLKAIFDDAIHDWEGHHRIVENFWSHTLLNTGRYHAAPIPFTPAYRYVSSNSISG